MQDSIEQWGSHDFPNHDKVGNVQKSYRKFIYLSIIILIGVFAITLLLWTRDTGSPEESYTEPAPLLANTMILITDFTDERERTQLVNEIQHILEPLNHADIQVQTIDGPIATVEQSRAIIQQWNSPEQRAVLLVWQRARLPDDTDDSKSSAKDWYITLDQRYLRFVTEPNAFPALLEQPTLLEITLSEDENHLALLSILVSGLTLFQNTYYTESLVKFETLSQLAAQDEDTDTEIFDFYRGSNLLVLGHAKEAQDILLKLAPDLAMSVQSVSPLQLSAADNLGLAALEQANYSGAYQYQQGLLNLHDLLEGSPGHGAVMVNMGVAAWGDKNTVAAQSRLESAQELFQQQEQQEARHSSGKAVVAEVLGRIASERYKPKDAVAHYEQALEFHQTSGNLPGQLAILDHLLTIFREEEAWYEVKAYTRQKRHIFAHQNNQEQQA